MKEKDGAKVLALDSHREKAIDSEVCSGASTEVRYPSGRVVKLLSEEREGLMVRGPSGQVELTVRFTDEGPVLVFEAADLQLKSARKIDLDCEQLNVRSRDGICMETGGDLEQKVHGDRHVEVEGRSHQAARSIHLTSELGNVEVKANDDVVMRGERIKLN